MNNLKRFNENFSQDSSTPFRNEFLEPDHTIGEYELYTDGSTGWGIIFPSGYLEVEEGPHPSAGWMNGEINGISISAKGYDTPSIPGSYWGGNLSDSELSKVFDKIIDRYRNVTRHF